jgi:Tfp pilus assembly pilus retraction ATPase PilT
MRGMSMTKTELEELGKKGSDEKYTKMFEKNLRKGIERANMKRMRANMKRMRKYETETSSSIPKEIPSLDQSYFDKYWKECCEGDKQNG